MNSLRAVSPEVAEVVAAGWPVVALEASVVRALVDSARVAAELAAALSRLERPPPLSPWMMTKGVRV